MNTVNRQFITGTARITRGFRRRENKNLVQFIILLKCIICFFFFLVLWSDSCYSILRDAGNYTHPRTLLICIYKIYHTYNPHGYYSKVIRKPSVDKFAMNYNYTSNMHLNQTIQYSACM